MSKKYVKNNADLLASYGISTEGKGRNQKRWAKRNPVDAAALENAISAANEAQSNANTYDQQLALKMQDYENDLALQQQQQEFDLMNDSTSYQRQVADMKAAGLNVNAIGGGNGELFGGGGLSTATSASQTPPGSSTAKKDTGGVNSALLLNAIMSVAHTHHSDVIDELYHAANTEINNAKKLVKEL